MIRRLIILLLIVGCKNPTEYQKAYDYSLEDINTSSATYGETISPGYFQGQVTLHYFGHQN